MNIGLLEYIHGVDSWIFNPEKVLDFYVQKSIQNSYNAQISVCKEYIHHYSEDFWNRLLKAAPIAIKDIIQVQWTQMTCGSKILQWYTSPYTATCVSNLEHAWWLMISKANMDEFAMGSSNETSVFGPVLNPCDSTRVAGGSSWGSAAAVAGNECIAALGTDTGGSVRLPAAFTGIVWLKPTNGRISRYGVQSMASLLDIVGVLTKNVKDAALLTHCLSGYDSLDATSGNRGDESDWRLTACNHSVVWLRIGVPSQYFGEGLEPMIASRIHETLDKLVAHGAVLVPLDLDILRYAIAIYYIICPAAVSSNMARFDAIKYGMQWDTSTVQDVYEYINTMRDQWFWDEVRRRIMVGSYVLSAWHSEQYYHKARSAQLLLRQTLDKVFGTVDVIVWPTSPCFPWKIWAKNDDPIAAYLADIYTISANLWWFPAISVPVWKVTFEWSSLPIGLHLMSARRREDTLFQVAHHIEWYLFD